MPSIEQAVVDRSIEDTVARENANAQSAGTAGESFYRALRRTIEDRVAQLEEEVARLRRITEHHGLRGPQA